MCYTSMLKRSLRTAWILLGEAKQHWVPVNPSWYLNERHYGALTGMSKSEATATLGHDEVMKWRKSWAAAPPPIETTHPLFNSLIDRRYAGVVGTHSILPSTESLCQCSDRVVAFWDSAIAPALRRGERPLVVAHAHTIRALVKYLDSITDQDIEAFTVPTGMPIIYSLDRQTLEPKRRRVIAEPQDLPAEILVDDTDVVSPETLTSEARTRHIEGVPYKPILYCNKQWRVLSAPGMTEENDILAEHRKIAESVNLGCGMVFLTKKMIEELPKNNHRPDQTEEFVER